MSHCDTGVRRRKRFSVDPVKTHILLIGPLLTAVACAAPQTEPVRATPAPAPKTVTEVEDKSSQRLGLVNRQPITRQDLAPEVQAELLDLENELEQRRLHLTWIGFEQELNQRLLEAEAERRGTQVDALIAELRAQAEVSDEAVRGLYEQNKDSIPVSFEEAAPTIRSQLESAASERKVREFSEELREKAEVSYDLPIPDLPRYDVKESEQPAMGKDAAPVTIVEFSDFQCPYCQQASSMLKELRNSYGDRVRIVFRDFPLSQHPDARPAAAAAHCADEQGRFWDYHDVLFGNPQELGAEKLKEYAGDLKLDLKAFESCLASNRPEKAIVADESEAQRLGIQGTPAIFINGVKLIGLLPLPLMKSLIDHELERS